MIYLVFLTIENKDDEDKSDGLNDLKNNNEILEFYLYL